MTKNRILYLNPEPAFWTLRQSPGWGSLHVNSVFQGTSWPWASLKCPAAQGWRPSQSPKPPWRKGGGSPFLEIRFGNKLWGAWAPLGGAPNTQLPAAASGGSTRLSWASPACGAFCSFWEMNSRAWSLQGPQEPWAGGVCQPFLRLPCGQRREVLRGWCWGAAVRYRSTKEQLERLRPH